MKMQFSTFDNATAKSRKCHINLGGRDEQQSFSNRFSSAGSQTFLYKTPKHTTIFNQIPQSTQTEA